MVFRPYFILYLEKGTGTCVYLLGGKVAGPVYREKSCAYRKLAQCVPVPTQGIPCKPKPAGYLIRVAT